ncbi:unnamed protein product [Effrenium voratum]|nr:unnamed protein product [Effrenium voratum]
MKPHSVRPSWLFSACVLWTHEVALAVPFGNAIFRQRLDHAQKLQEKLNPPGIHVEDPSKIQTFCKQRLDHFDHSNGKLWCQRFVADATYFKAKGPVFLCLDGEDRPWGRGGKAHTLTCNNMVELAPRFGALLVALEHRYYGGMDFDGVPDFSTPNLRYLSSRQALADANAFKSFLEAKLRLEGSPWVAFGGSYSGALAAWVRQLYPEAFAAAVASSAPVEAQLNFQGYFNVVASTLTASSVGGSPACLATILNGHQEAARRLGSSEGRRFLEQQFHLCGKNPLEVRKNVAGWAGMGLVTTTQYNSNRCSSTSCNVGLLCSTLARLRAETSSDLEAVIRLHHLQEAEVGATECADVSWDAWLDTLKLTEKVNTSSPLADSQHGGLHQHWALGVI